MRFTYQNFSRPIPSISLNNRSTQPRPVASLSLIGPASRHVDAALIDSGSDESFFAESVAAKIGIDLVKAPRQTFRGQGGGQMTARFAQVTLRMSDGDRKSTRLNSSHSS